MIIWKLTIGDKMDLFFLLGWLIYGIVVGLIVKAIYKTDVKSGLLTTLLVGVSGSFVGGFIKFLITGEGSSFQPSGILFGVIGGILACYLYKKFIK